MKTCKIFIGGKFPRTENGPYYQPKGSDGKPLANICRSSRKDVRDAVIAAHGAVRVSTLPFPIKDGDPTSRAILLADHRVRTRSSPSTVLVQRMKASQTC